MSDFSEKEREFLIGLEELTRRTGIAVVGCGCCGSPGLDHLQDDEFPPEAGYGHESMRDFEWIAPGDYAWKRGARPVKPEK